MVFPRSFPDFSEWAKYGPVLPTPKKREKNLEFPKADNMLLPGESIDSNLPQPSQPTFLHNGNSLPGDMTKNMSQYFDDYANSIVAPAYNLPEGSLKVTDHKKLAPEIERFENEVGSLGGMKKSDRIIFDSKFLDTLEKTTVLWNGYKVPDSIPVGDGFSLKYETASDREKIVGHLDAMTKFIQSRNWKDDTVVVGFEGIKEVYDFLFDTESAGRLIPEEYITPFTNFKNAVEGNDVNISNSKHEGQNPVSQIYYTIHNGMFPKQIDHISTRMRDALVPVWGRLEAPDIYKKFQLENNRNPTAEEWEEVSWWQKIVGPSLSENQIREMWRKEDPMGIKYPHVPDNPALDFGPPLWQLEGKPKPFSEEWQKETGALEKFLAYQQARDASLNMAPMNPYTMQGYSGWDVSKLIGPKGLSEQSVPLIQGSMALLALTGPYLSRSLGAIANSLRKISYLGLPISLPFRVAKLVTDPVTRFGGPMGRWYGEQQLEEGYQQATSTLYPVIQDMPEKYQTWGEVGIGMGGGLYRGVPIGIMLGRFRNTDLVKAFRPEIEAYRKLNNKFTPEALNKAIDKIRIVGDGYETKTPEQREHLRNALVKADPLGGDVELATQLLLKPELVDLDLRDRAMVTYLMNIDVNKNVIHKNVDRLLETTRKGWDRINFIKLRSYGDKETATREVILGTVGEEREKIAKRLRTEKNPHFTKLEKDLKKVTEEIKAKDTEIANSHKTGYYESFDREYPNYINKSSSKNEIKKDTAILKDLNKQRKKIQKEIDAYTKVSLPRQVGHWLDHYKNVPFRIDTPEDVAKYIGEVYGDEAGKLTLPFLKDMEVAINDIHEQLLGIPDGKGFGRLFDNIQILDQDARERFFKRTGSERFDIKQAEAYSGDMPTPYPVSRFTNKEEATSRLLQQFGLIRKFVSINIDPKSKTDPQVVADTVIHETTHIFDNFIKHAISPEAYRGHMDPIMRWWIDNIGIRQDKHKGIARAFDSRDIFKARNNHEATGVWAIGDRKLTDEQTEAIRKLLTDAEAEALPEIIVRWQKNKGKLLTGYSNSELGTYLDIITKAIGTTLRKVNLSGSNLDFVTNLGDQVTNADINKIPGSNILRWFLDPAEGFPKDYDLLNAERGAKHLDPSSPGSLNSHQFLNDFEYKRINPESNKHELWVATAMNSQLRRFKEVIRLGKPINDFNAEDFLEDIGLGALGNNTLSKQGDEIMSRFWAEYIDPENPPITSVLTEGEIQYRGIDVSSDKFLRSQRISDLFAQFGSQESLAKRITKLHSWQGRRPDPDLDPEVTKNLIKGMQIENDSITRARDILLQRFRYTRSPFQGLRDPNIDEVLNPQPRTNPILQIEQYSPDELMKLRGPSRMGVYGGMLEPVPLTRKQIEWYTGPIGRFDVSLFMKRVGLKELPYDIGGYDVPRPGDLDPINWLELAKRTDRWLSSDPSGTTPILDIFATTDIPRDAFDPRNLEPGGKAMGAELFLRDLLNDEVTRDTLIRTGQKDMYTQEFELMMKMMNTLRLINIYTNRRLDDIVKNEGIVDDTVAGAWIKNFSDNRDSSGIYSAIVDANNWKLEDGSLKATLWWNNSNAAKYIGFTADQDMATLNSVFGDGVFFHTASTWNKNFLGDLGTRYKNIQNIPRLAEARRLGFDLPELKKLVRGDSGFEFTESLVQASMKALYLYNPKLYNPTKDYQAQGILHAVRLNVPNGNHIFLDSTLPVEKITRKLETPLEDLEFVSDLPDPSQLEVFHQFNKHIKIRKPGELEIIGDLGAIDSFSYVDLNHNYSIRRMMDLHELGDKYDSRIDEYPWRTSHLTKGMERDAKIHTMISTIRDWQYKFGFKGDPSLLSPQITKYGKNRHLNTTNPKEFPTIRLEGQSFESLSARERASHFIPDKDIYGNPILPLGNYHRPGLIFREDAYNIMMGSYDPEAHRVIRDYQLNPIKPTVDKFTIDPEAEQRVIRNINDAMSTQYDGYALNLENRTLLDDILSNKYNDFFDIFERSTKKAMMQAQYIIENSALGQIPIVEELRPMAGMMGNAPVRSGPEPVMNRDFSQAGAGWNIFDYVRLLESNGNDQTYEGFLATQFQKNSGTQRTLDWHDYINKTVSHSRLSLLESILSRNDSVLDMLDMNYLRIHENTFRDLISGTQDEWTEPLDAIGQFNKFNESMKPLLENAKTTVESSAYSNWMEDLYRRFLLPEGINREVRYTDILDKFTGKNGVINGTGDWDDPINSVSMLLDHAVMFNRYVEMLMQEFWTKKGMTPSKDYVDAIDRASRMSPDEGLYSVKLLKDLDPSELQKRIAKNKHTAERNKNRMGVSHQEYPLSEEDQWAGLGIEDRIELVPKFTRNPYKNSFTMGRIREWIWNNYADANASKHGKSIAELFEGYRKWVREYHSKTKPDQTPRNYMGDFVSNEKPVGRYSEYIRNRQTSFQQKQLAQKELLLQTSLGMDNAISRAFNLERTTDYVKNSFYDNYVADLNKKGIRAGSHNSQQRYQDSSFMSRAPILFAREAEDAERMVVEGTNRYTTIDNGARPNPKSSDYEDGAEEVREAYDIEKGGGFEFKRVTDPWEDAPKDKDGKSIGKLNGEDIDQLSSPLTDAQMELQKRIDILKKINEEIGDAPVESPKKAIAKSIQKVNKDYYEIEWGGEKDHVPKYVADIIKKDGAITSTGELSRQATDEIANAWRGRVTSWVSRERKLRDATQSELARKRKKPAAIFAQDPYDIKRLPIIAKAQGEAQIETTVTTPEMTKTEFYAVFKSGWDKIADISVRDNYYQAGTARRFADGLRKLVGVDADITKARAEWKRTKGQILTSGELDALEVVFGKEIIDELAKAQRSSFGNLWDFVVGVWNIPRSVMSSIDFSGLLRQGGILLAPYPKEWGASIGPALKAMLSEGNMHKVNAEMESHPLFKYFQDVGELYFARDTLYEREEAFISGIANKIPGISHSSRFHATFLNALRFKSMLAAYKKMISEGYKHDTPKMNVNVKQYAKFVNYATGRGDLGKIKIFGRETGFDLNKIAPVTNGVFWSARLFVSRYQVPLSILMAHNAGAKWARNTIIFDLVKTSALIGMVIGIMKAGGADVQDDPESTDFGKGKWGPQRIDLNAGYGNIISNTWKIISGKTTNAQGDSLPVYGGRGNQLLRFLKSKTSPQFNIALDMIRGRNYYGEDIDLADPDSLRNEAGNRFVPLALQEVREAVNMPGTLLIGEGENWKNESVGWLSLLSFVGGGSNSYHTKEDLSEAVFGRGYNQLWPYERKIISAGIEMGGQYQPDKWTMLLSEQEYLEFQALKKLGEQYEASIKAPRTETRKQLIRQVSDEFFEIRRDFRKQNDMIYKLQARENNWDIDNDERQDIVYHAPNEDPNIATAWTRYKQIAREYEAAGEGEQLRVRGEAGIWARFEEEVAPNVSELQLNYLYANINYKAIPEEILKHKDLYDAISTLGRFVKSEEARNIIDKVHAQDYPEGVTPNEAPDRYRFNQPRIEAIEQRYPEIADPNALQ